MTHKFFWPGLAIFIGLASVNCGFASEFVCRPFEVFPGALPKKLWNKSSVPANASLRVEAELKKKISKIKTLENFSSAYANWIAEHPELSLADRIAYLHCVYFYVRQDSNGNGIPDWTALVDGRPSRVLFPQNDDIDGDGIPNVLDPNPFDPKPEIEVTGIPLHLRITRADTSELQELLYKNYGILAIDHTDEHAPIVLRSLLFLLKSSPGLSSYVKNIHYLYAFAGHDAQVNIAAFHRQAKALSIGGRSAYTNDPEEYSISILTALAHELGHAFLFENMTPEELRKIAVHLGSWGSVFEKIGFTDFYSAPFMAKSARRNSSNATSQYAETNIHEWFADAFAAAILQKLGKSGLLGSNWKKQLVLEPKRPGEFWANYNNAPLGFPEWLQAKLAERPQELEATRNRQICLISRSSGCPMVSAANAPSRPIHEAE